MFFLISKHRVGWVETRRVLWALYSANMHQYVVYALCWLQLPNPCVLPLSGRYYTVHSQTAITAPFNTAHLLRSVSAVPYSIVAGRYRTVHYHGVTAICQYRPSTVNGWLISQLLPCFSHRFSDTVPFRQYPQKNRYFLFQVIFFSSIFSHQFIFNAGIVTRLGLFRRNGEKRTIGI